MPETSCSRETCPELISNRLAALRYASRTLMSRKLLLLPPLAFARIGISPEPVDWFLWGPNDDSLRGTGKTTVFRCTLDQDGRPVPDPEPNPLIFRDKEKGLRPVCPYFELYEQIGNT